MNETARMLYGIANVKLYQHDEKETYMSFGEKLRCLRTERGLTQEQLAEQFNVTRQTISKWELNQVLPETAKLLEIAGFFDASLDDLLLNKEQGETDLISHLSETLPDNDTPTGSPDSDSRSWRSAFCLSGFQKLQLGGILLLTLILLWNPAKDTSHFSPLNLLDSSFIIILALTLAGSLLFKVMFHQNVKLSKLIAVFSVCIGLGLSVYYFFELLHLGDLNRGLRIVLLPLYYGILFGFIAGFIEK